MIDYSDFNWGPNKEWYKKAIIKEIFGGDNIYERYYKIKENDIILDLGASVGPFAYSIKDRNISKIILVEPLQIYIEALLQNIKNLPYRLFNYAISNVDYKIIDLNWDGFITQVPTITFKELISRNDLTTIDFLKTDCEGGEYDIFTKENLDFIKNNIKNIAGEWHLGSPDVKIKFRNFRDLYLKTFPNFKIHAVSGQDITNNVWNEDFIQYYSEIIIYINNN